METHAITTYSFDELSAEAQEKAVEDYRNGQEEIFWNEEIIDSLKGLFEATNGVKMINYSLGLQQSWIKVSFDNDEVAELSGKRAMAWLENNLLSNIRISYYGKEKAELRQYGEYYRPGMIKPCPFTGVCFDEDFIDSLHKDIKDGCDLKTAFEGLASEYERLVNAEWEYQNSEEYIKEHFEANEYQFEEDGSLY